MAVWVRALSGDKLDAKLFGQNVRLHTHNNGSEIKALMSPSRYSSAAFAFAADHFPQKGGVFVDVGANAGLFSLGILNFLPGGILIAVEPQAGLCRRLRDNLTRLNSNEQGRPDIHIFETAIGGNADELTLWVPDQLGQASARKIEGADPIKVPARPLLEVLREAKVDRLDVMKVDVEGFEDEVIMPFFEAAPETLWPKAIVLEHCHRDRWLRNCEADLVRRGYMLVERDRTNHMFVRGDG